MTQNLSYLVAARRTAVVPRNGDFASLALHDLAAPVIIQVLTDAGIHRDRVGELIVANVLGEGGNPARLIALEAGLPLSVAGLSVDRQCAGGLDAILLADSLIRSGRHDVVVAGGVESYSRRPIRLRTFPDGSEPENYDQARFTPWPDRDPDMAVAADALARALSISRDEQDRWAIESHRKALAIPDPVRKEQVVGISGLTADPFTRPLGEGLCARAGIVSGSITSANMAVAADAAAFVVMVSEKVASGLDVPTMELIEGVTIGGDPELPGLAPVQAIKTVLQASGMNMKDFTVAEIMEAFAVQAIACQRKAAIPPEIINPYGGSLARGHPIGASGAILMVNLFHFLVRQGGAGLAAIAAAGGIGTALISRRID